MGKRDSGINQKEYSWDEVAKNMEVYNECAEQNSYYPVGENPT